MRIVFDSLAEMAEFIFDSAHRPSKQSPYRVEIDGHVKFVLSGNSDQAVAAVARALSDIKVVSVPIIDLVHARSEEALHVNPSD